MRDIYALRGNYTKFGEHWDLDLFGLIEKLIEENEIDGKDYDLLVLSNMLGQIQDNQSQLASIISSKYFSSIPALRVESACASGGVALKIASSFLKSGEFSNILVLGVEKMSDASTENITFQLETAGLNSTSYYQNISFPSQYALYADFMINNKLITKETLYNISAKNHKNALSNNRSQFHLKLTKTIYDNSPMISSPLNLFDCSPISDGAAYLHLSTDKKQGLKLQTINLETGPASPEFSENLFSIEASIKASKKSYAEAKIKPNDISIIELHDCFTVAEAMAISDLGLSPLKKLDSYLSKIDNSKINPSGGLKACGHPVAATGVKQVVSLLENLKNNELGLAHNVGGTGQTVVVSIWEKL